MQDKGSPKPLNPKNAYFIIGKHNLDSTSEDDYDTCAIEKFVMHDFWMNNFKLNTYDGDIALAFLKNSVEFSNTVQPICLYPQKSDFNDVILRNGRIAGWGATEKKELSTTNPTIIQMTVHKNDACIESDPAFTYILTRGSFCAKGITTGVCKGGHYYFIKKYFAITFDILRGFRRRFNDESRWLMEIERNFIRNYSNSMRHWYLKAFQVFSSGFHVTFSLEF